MSDTPHSLNSAYQTRQLRKQTTLSNWRHAPFNRWAFHHVRELLPTGRIAPSDRHDPLVYRSRPIDHFSVPDRHGKNRRLEDVWRICHTDALLVLHDDTVLCERYQHGMQPEDPHILMSVSKSLTACVVGILIDRGILAPDQPLATYIDALEGSGYADASLQDLLDMRAGIAFDEDYYATTGEMIAYREAGGWNPRSIDDAPRSLSEFISGLSKDRAHGGAFCYTSPNSDLLGWLVEAVCDAPFFEVASELLWRPMGAEHEAFVTLDSAGGCRTAGGINCSMRDLARLGRLMLNNGVAGGRSVLPSWWATDTTRGGDREAWINGNFAHLLPTGRYRNQWYQYGNELDAFCGIGIHGQLLYVSPVAGVVIVHLGSHPEPFNVEVETLLIDAIDHLARACSGTR